MGDDRRELRGVERSEVVERLDRRPERDEAEELRRQAELHSLRPADSKEALPFDDPDADPYRLAALKYLREKLGPPVDPGKK